MSQSSALSFFRARSEWLLLLCSALLVFASAEVLKIEKQNEKRYLIPPPPMIERYSIGYSAPIADMIWIRSVQDIDYCEEKTDAINCRNSGWLFHMVDAVTNLVPKYRIAYSGGGPALSVLVSDIEGARVIFDKGVKAYPNDWQILYMASYHYLYEVKDNVKAADLAVRAAQNGAPPWLYALATRLYTKEGKVEVGEGLYAQLKQQGNVTEEVLARLRARIDEAKKEPAKH